MNLLKLLLIPPLILVLQYLIEDSLASTSESSKRQNGVKGFFQRMITKNVSSNGKASGNDTKCGEYSVDNLTDEFVIPDDSLCSQNFKIQKNIKFDKPIQVVHALWVGGKICVEMKIFKLNDENAKKAYYRESKIFNSLKESLLLESPVQMITMYYSVIMANLCVMVFDKVEMNIKQYYHYEVNKKDSDMKDYNKKLEFLTKIVIGAAQALARLHKYRYVHLNVKAQNFVYVEKPDHKKEEIPCKLTGLDNAVKLENCSICLEKNNNNSIELPCGHCFHQNCISGWASRQTCPNCRETFDQTVIAKTVDQKYSLNKDIKYFGFMVYNLLINDKINDEEKIRKEINKYISKKEKKGKKGNKLSNLERVIKSCNQDKYEDIPKMDEILMFLKGHITLFPYEERERERMVNLEHESLKRLYGESGYDERSHGKSFLRKLFPCF